MDQSGHPESRSLEGIGSRGACVGEPDQTPARAEVQKGAGSVLAKALLSNGRCGSCRYQIHVLEEPHFALIKAAVIKVNIDKKQVYAKCPKCKNWLMVPLQYSREAGSAVR